MVNCGIVVRGETPDILPRVPILMAFAAQYIGSNYGAFAADYRVLVAANLRCAQPPLADDKDLRRLQRPEPPVSARMLDRVRAVQAFTAAAFKRHPFFHCAN